MVRFNEKIRIAKIRDVAAILKRRYSDFNHLNKKNPLDELLFIICSITTTHPVYLRTYAALKKRFPRYENLARASIREIAAPIKPGGQYTQKARTIKAIIKRLNCCYGKPTLAPLRKMTEAQCEKFLITLPGVGKKVARCVMLYSLGFPVFPVDTHCRRIVTRLGLISSKKSQDDDEIQRIIPRRLRRSLHVNFISLGREFCRSQRPRCGECPLARNCRKVGINEGPR